MQRRQDARRAGFDRREWLRVGGLGCFGLSLGGLLAKQTQAAAKSATFGRAKSCLLLFLAGGPPQHETFDPKPDAPQEVRGPFCPIATRVPGTQICELLPQTAALADRMTFIRSMTTGINAHSASGYWMLTGYPHPAGNAEVPASSADWPTLGAVARAMRASEASPLSAVTLPGRLVNNPNVPWPGQDGGFMGSAWDPYLLECDPTAANFRIDSLSLPDDISASRLTARQGLLKDLGQQAADLRRSGNIETYSRASQQAFELLSAGPTRAAFDLDREPGQRRDRYGRHRFGQSVLLGRRLIEAGVRLVQVNYPREPGDLTAASPLWDTHSDNAGRVKNVLCPQLDSALPALLTDLEASGLLDETLVVVMGEFGRSPKINPRGGRDHWGACFSIALAGAGIPRGTVIGASDRLGATVAQRPIRPPDLAATIFHYLGIDPAAEFHDRQQRPRRVSTGQPIAELV